MSQPVTPSVPARPDDELVDLLRGATQRVVRSVDSLPDDQWAEASLLPGWRRAHVVAHLVLNAEGLAASLQALAEDRSEPMYPSQESRDVGIDELAAASSSELRSRLLASTTLFSDAVAVVPDDAWGTPIERVAGGSHFSASDAPHMRLRELEIHHVDLATGYSASDWSPAFCGLLVDALVARGPGDLTVVATDLDRTWVSGTGAGPTISGPAAALGWWLSGRGPDSGPGDLTSDDGVLPRIEAW